MLRAAVACRQLLLLCHHAADAARQAPKRIQLPALGDITGVFVLLLHVHAWLVIRDPDQVEKTMGCQSRRSLQLWSHRITCIVDSHRARQQDKPRQKPFGANRLSDFWPGHEKQDRSNEAIDDRVRRSTSWFGSLFPYPCARQFENRNSTVLILRIVLAQPSTA